MLSQAANTRVVGLDVTHSCTFTGAELTGLHGRGKFGTFLSRVTAFYLKYHRYSSTSYSAIPIVLSFAGVALKCLCPVHKLHGQQPGSMLGRRLQHPLVNSGRSS